MIYKTVDTLPFSFSALGLRTWSDETSDRSSVPVDSNELIAAVQTALELGMTYLEVFSSRATAPSAEVISKCSRVGAMALYWPVSAVPTRASASRAA